jgi:hypothetical protein
MRLSLDSSHTHKWIKSYPLVILKIKHYHYDYGRDVLGVVGARGLYIMLEEKWNWTSLGD